MKRHGVCAVWIVMVAMLFGASGCAPRAARTADVEAEDAKPQALAEAAPRDEAATHAAPEREMVSAPQRESVDAPESETVAAPQRETPEAPATDEAPAVSSFVAPFPGVRVRVEPATIEIEGVRCLDVGWLEQVACSPNTREHESLVVVDAKPSHIHGALLMAGFEPGRPGQWIYHDEEARIEVRPPTGDKLRITMRYERDGEVVEAPVRSWIRDHLGEQTFPDEPWVFAGSMFAPNPEFMGPGEHYVADQTGSIIGLVTFGDEVIAYSDVIADQTSVQPAEWEVDDEAAPPVGTRVVIVITRWEELKN